ncbi:ArsR/SmtB family transcription factor [Streptomyces phaeochromogenes]|uniref:ArsR/SmtB family transcription factor n=1 Tax=Streptomyces phaeochromogenes TaxID=1923 RepID=UPI000A440BCA|nr:metalloregulator ArsR/SmtB family transcription factor [Streptomyces phaeochromogenes]
MSDDSLWAALADPHRRAIVALLLERPRPVGEIVEACGLSQPSTSKHLRVLRDAGLVRVRQDAQRRVYALDPAPIAELDAWLAPYRKLWSTSLDALGRRLDETVTDTAAETAAAPGESSDEEDADTSTTSPKD